VFDQFRQTVRCSKGHVFTTTWVPMASFTAIRLGRSRYMRCPVGKHWAICRKVADADVVAPTPS
jgi:hypothetical protein